MSYHVKIILLSLAIILPTHTHADWSGAYGGFSFGTNTANEISGEVDVISQGASHITSGLFAGYAVQNAEFVLGGEFSALRTPDVELEGNRHRIRTDYTILDLKGHAGYKVNNILFYGIAGLSHIYMARGRANGFNYGIGVAYDLGNNTAIGAEYLARRATGNENDNIDIGDVDLDTLAFRAAFSF